MNCPRRNNPYDCPCGAPVCREQTAGLEQTWDFDGDDTACLACGFRANCSWWLDYDFHLTWPEKYEIPKMPETTGPAPAIKANHYLPLPTPPERPGT